MRLIKLSRKQIQLAIEVRDKLLEQERLRKEKREAKKLEKIRKFYAFNFDSYQIQEQDDL